MHITKAYIKKEFVVAESNLDFCWQLLTDIKEFETNENDFGKRFIIFQEKLASTIFNLQSIRDKIIVEEKYYIKNKKKYNFEWFKAKMRLLSDFKEGIDHVVNLSKALGDAYAYFFYQLDLKLLSEHLSHQKIVNHTAGSGEKGELEFVKNIKQIDGHFTLFHGITNILRYGDFSFVDLKTMKVVQIGELKTSTIDENNFTLNLSIVSRESLQKKTSQIKNTNLEKHRRGRQLLAIMNFFIKKEEPNSTKKDLANKSYFKEVEALLRKASVNKYNFVKVSNGLAFLCVKYKKGNLYYRIFKRGSATKNKVEKTAQKVIETVNSLMKPSPAHNSLIIGQLLYDRGFSDKNIKGVIPLFWQPINNKLLKEVYFTDCVITLLFNPIHLIEEIEIMGYGVESKYSNSTNLNKLEAQKNIQHFDSFIPYIIDYLLTENFVIDSIKEAEKYSIENGLTHVSIKPQQRISTSDISANLP